VCVCAEEPYLPHWDSRTVKLLLQCSYREVGQICFPIQIYFSDQNDLETLHTQLDYRAIRNIHLWLVITFYIPMLSPHLFFSYLFAEVE